METHSDLVIDGEGAEMGEIAIGVVGERRDQDQQDSRDQRRKGLAIEEGLLRR